jgi:cytochrome c oxidase cbb3-type subunit 4
MADSWGLLLLVIAFVAASAFVFRPGSKQIYEKAARLPLDSEKDHP